MMTMKFDHQKINNILHSRIRLSIVAALATADEMDFNTLKREVNTTDGNLSVHLKKLEDTGYVTVSKRFADRKPLTTCAITAAGIEALETYFSTVEEFIRKKQ